MIVFECEGEKLDKGETRKIIKFLRDLAKTAKPKDDYFGICCNLNTFIEETNISGGAGWLGYDIVETFSVGFPNVKMSKATGKKHLAYAYPIGYPQEEEKLWEVGNRRTELCTHIANRLQELL